MNKLTLVAILLISTVAKAQTKILDTTMIWSIAVGGWGPIITEVNYFKGDSTIGNKSYLKLHHGVETQNFPMVLTSNYQYYLMREDSGKVYLKHSNNNEILLFNFNLSVGDSTELQGHWQYVSYIDSMQFDNGIKRKRINFTNGNYWIEGIGGRNGVYQDNVNEIYADAYSELCCIKENGTLIYHNPTFQNCFFDYTSVNEIELNSTQNICYNNSIIKNNSICDSKINIVNIYGQNLIELTLKSQMTFDVSILPNGIYFIKDFNSEIFKRFVKY